MAWRPARSSSSTLPPSITITLSLEAPPQIHSDALTDAEATRLADWVLAHDDIVALVEQAIEIRETWLRRAA